MNRVLLVPERLLGLGVSQCLLDRKSIRLRTARSAPEALSITSVWKPELIIASNDVGDTREGSATKFLRALRLRVPAGRIILISERLSFDDEEQISLVDVRLVEPLDERSFSETVASLLSSRGPQAERRASPMMAAVGRDPGSVAREVARIRNIGVTGCELEMQNAVPIGETIELRFSLPDATTPIVTRARVTRLVDEVLLRYDVAFEDLEASSAEQLSNFCQKGGD
jgi:hypothetical protein